MQPALTPLLSKPELFWSNKTDFKAIDLIQRASTVKGLTDIDLNYPDHTAENFKETISCSIDNGLDINGFAMRLLQQ